MSLEVSEQQKTLSGIVKWVPTSTLQCSRVGMLVRGLGGDEMFRVSRWGFCKGSRIQKHVIELQSIRSGGVERSTEFANRRILDVAHGEDGLPITILPFSAPIETDKGLQKQAHVV